MARGWESKSIESQQEEASRPKALGPRLTAEAVARQDRRRTLQLARARVEAELARATAPPHRHMLEQALATLDRQIGDLP